MAITLGTDYTGINQQNLTGDTQALSPRVFTAVMRGAMLHKRITLPGWFDSTQILRAHSKTVERMGDIKPDLIARGSNVTEFGTGGGGLTSQPVKRDRYITAHDDRPYGATAAWDESDRLQSVDLGENYEARLGVQLGNNHAKAEDLKTHAGLIITASMPDPLYGGGRTTKAEAGDIAYGTGAASRLENGYFLDANLDSATITTAANAAERLVARAQIYAELMDWDGPMQCLMASTLIDKWLGGMGKHGTASSAGFIPAQALNRDLSPKIFGSYAEGFIGNFRGFDIIRSKFLAQLGTFMDNFFPAANYGGAAGSKYMPGTAHNTAGNGQSMNSIAGFLPSDSTVFEQGQTTNNPTQWDTSGGTHHTIAAFNGVRAIFFQPGAIEEMHLFRPMAFGLDETRRSWSRIYRSISHNGYGPVEPQKVFYATVALG